MITGTTIPSAILLDLLMATMDSISTWSSAAGDRDRGLAWRDAATRRMIGAGTYVPYDELVADAAADEGLEFDAPDRLRDAWMEMQRWPDTGALEALSVPFAFVTNCSADLATAAVERSGLRPAFALSAEEAGWYKPRPEIYRLACERMAVPADEVRYVAGAPYDAEGARAAGLRSVLIARREMRLPPNAEIAVVASLEDALGVV